VRDVVPVAVDPDHAGLWLARLRLGVAVGRAVDVRIRAFVVRAVAVCTVGRAASGVAALTVTRGVVAVACWECES